MADLAAMARQVRVDARDKAAGNRSTDREMCVARAVDAFTAGEGVNPADQERLISGDFAGLRLDKADRQATGPSASRQNSSSMVIDSSRSRALSRSLKRSTTGMSLSSARSGYFDSRKRRR